MINLTGLMERTSGNPEVRIGLVDGPVLMQHPDLPGKRVHSISRNISATCTGAKTAACLHGTFVAGILSAKRNSPAPGICPNCTLLVRPVFSEGTLGSAQVPSATPQELAAAILDCLDAGARVVNLSVALAQPSIQGEEALEDALHLAARRGVLVVAAAGNQGLLGSSPITRHPWVVPVVGCDHHGRPLSESNLGRSIGRRGVTAPGDAITSLGTERSTHILRGTSVAVPFVTGAIALLWSEFPAVSATHMKLAISQASAVRRASIVPPMLNCAATYQFLVQMHRSVHRNYGIRTPRFTSVAIQRSLLCPSTWIH